MKERGISSGNRNFIVTLLFFVLLFWGPTEPYSSIGIRIELIVLPVVAWFCIGYLGKYWNFDEIKNDRLNRAIVGIIAGLLFAGSFQEYTAGQHLECTQEIRNRDGVECVGDYVTVDGPDKGQALVLTLLGVGAVWYAVADHKEKISGNSII